jgi:signal transduction histidine kinase
MNIAGLRAYIYALPISLVAVAAMFALPGSGPSGDIIYLPMALAILVGLLLTVRLAANRPVASLVLVPAIAMDARFGFAALPAVAYVAIVASLIRGVRGPRVLSTTAHVVLAFVAGHGLAYLIPAAPEWAMFAIGFEVARIGLWELALRLDPSPALAPNIVDRPAPLLTLPLAPVGLFPLAAGERLGDGALLMATAALLCLLFVVREAANLATARAEMESERDRLARANALQDDLIHLITHELRNPLTLVLSYAQMARRSSLEEDYEKIPAYVGQIERAGRTIQRLVDNLLQLSKIEHSDELPASEPVAVDGIVNQVVMDLAPLARQKQQELKVEAGYGLQPALTIPLLLREALSNLLSNAVKYTPEGGQISVRADRGDDPNTIVLIVRDTGIGLTNEDQARLFTKFFRSSDPRVQRERGTGLGLALTHALVTRIGGKISVQSEPGKGTTFRLTLPAVGSAA